MSIQGSRRSLDNRSVLDSLQNKKSKKHSEILDNSSKPCHQYNTRSSSSLSETSCEQCKSNNEYLLVVQQALKEVLEQNDALRSRVAELEAIISQNEDDLEEKNLAIQQFQNAVKEAISENTNEKKKKAQSGKN